MTALAGGAADKIGNRYEHWWTACRIADLLEGKAHSIRLEPPGRPGEGVEFIVEEAGRRVGEQVKNGTSAPWTISRLRSEGVLGDIATQLDQHRTFRLVIADAAVQLRTLTDRASAAKNLQELETLLGGRCDRLDAVTRVWNVDRETGWQMLSRIDVIHHSEDSLRVITESRWERLYVGDPGVVIGTVRAFCDDNLHRTITAPQVRTYLEAQGFRPALLAGDQTVLRRLASSVARQRRAVDAVAPSRGRVPRTVSAKVFQQLDEGAHRVLVLDGEAGSGKSAVAAEVAQHAETAGWTTAALRMDGFASPVRTSTSLGEQADLGGCPVTLLAGAAGEHPSLLVVDQLDAVSTHSGRMSSSFEAVDDLLERARSASALRVLLVVRSVDLRADPRLSRLLADENRVARMSVGLLAREDVEGRLGTDVHSSLDAPTRDLLRTPLHLAVFLRLSEQRSASHRTLTDLYDEYTRQTRARLDERPGGCDVLGITDALARAMSDDEVLVVPSWVLEAHRVSDVGAVESEGLIVLDAAARTIRFFHETYLDYVFARWFLRERRDLHDHLAASGQALFQRALTRQVLTLLAAIDRRRFHSTVVRLLTSSHIRAHLKMLAVDVLSTFDAEPEDWTCVEPLAWGDDHLAGRVRALLVHPSWFDAVDCLGRWEKWLADEAALDRVFPFLSRCGRERPHRVDALVRPFVGTSTAWDERLRHLVSWSLCPGLMALTVSLYEHGAFDVLGGTAGVTVSIDPITGLFDEDTLSVAAPLLGAWLNRGVELVRRSGHGDPFTEGVLARNVAHDSSVRDVVRLAPAPFVAEVLPAIVQIATAHPRVHEDLLSAGPFAARYRGTSYGMDQAIFNGLEDALRHLAVQDHTSCDTALAQLSVPESDELRFLVCRTLTFRGDADAAIEWLLSDDRHFYLGWSDNMWWAARELIEAWSPTCSQRVLERLESTVLTHHAPFETRGSIGRTQHELLSGIAPARLSEGGHRRLVELSRRYPPPRAPQKIEAHFVGSPIFEDAALKMSDERWLDALQKHDTDELRFDDDLRRIGGARELAMQVGRHAESEPARFARMALKFDASIPAAAIDQVVRSIAGKVDIDLLADVCEHAHDLHGPVVGLSICWAVGDSGTASARLVALLTAHAEDPDPAGGAPVVSGEGNPLMAGMNCTRGAAAMATARVLASSADHVDALLPVVERLATDEVPYVRVVAAEAVLMLMNHRRQRALEIALDLFGDPVTVLSARTTARLLRHAMVRAPETFAPVLRACLGAEGESGRYAGQVWAATALYAELPIGAVTDVAALPVDARRGAAGVFATDPGAALEHLIVLADDDDGEVLSSVGGAARHLNQLDDQQMGTMITALLASRACEVSLQPLLDALEGLPDLPVAALEVCSMATNLAGAEASDIRTGNAALARDALTLVLRLYRAGDEGVRSACLDVVDRLSEVGAYGLTDALAAER